MVEMNTNETFNGVQFNFEEERVCNISPVVSANKNVSSAGWNNWWTITNDFTLFKETIQRMDVKSADLKKLA